MMACPMFGDVEGVLWLPRHELGAMAVICPCCVTYAAGRAEREAEIVARIRHFGKPGTQPRDYAEQIADEIEYPTESPSPPIAGLSAVK